MLMNKKQKSGTFYSLASKIMGSKYHVLVFVVAFALTGGTFLLMSSKAAIPYATDPSHAAACVQNTPSKTAVRPGENFTAVVRIQNTGSSTFSGAFGTALAEYRDGPGIWSASGLDLSGNVPPGGIATFNLSLKAPSNPGLYSFEWGMAIVFQGYIRNPCTGVGIAVANPPTVTLVANNQNSNISVTKGASLALSWTSANNPSSCTASGSWGGAKAGSGLESRTGDTGSTGTKTYTLTCSNVVGSGSATRAVTVTAPPPAPATPSTGTPTKTPAKSSGSNTSKNKTTTQTPSAASAASVTTPPGVAEAFSARVVDESSIELTWKSPTYEGIITGYELERSTNKTDWTKINDDLIPDNMFTDTDVKFETTYYYRLKTVGANKMKSDYATTEVTTNKFESNTSDGETTLTSEDQRVNVYIPDDAIDGDALCTLRNNADLLPPTKNKYEPFEGPYQILCKKADGSIIANFKTPVRITVNAEKSGFKKLAYFNYTSDWEEVDGTLEKSLGTFEIKDQTSFAVLGQKSSTPLWLKIIISIIVLLVVIVGGLRLIYFVKGIQQRNAIKQKSEDYYHKEHGI